MDNNTRVFVRALRAACDRALDDGVCGGQNNHIEQIIVEDAETPVQLQVRCYGDYDWDLYERVYGDQSIIDAFERVARCIASRAARTFNNAELQ